MRTSINATDVKRLFIILAIALPIHTVPAVAQSVSHPSEDAPSTQDGNSISFDPDPDRPSDWETSEPDVSEDTDAANADSHHLEISLRANSRLLAALLQSKSITPEQAASIQAMWWAKGSAWEHQVKDVIHQLFVCKATDPVADRSPCNYFAGKYLNLVYGINDFNTAHGYLSADQMISTIYTSGSLWKEIGSAADQLVLDDAQKRANSNAAVLAFYPSRGGKPGHVALILPGKTLKSSSWSLQVPNSASFFLDDPARSYVGKGLSNAFGATKKGDVRLFYRIGT